MQRAHTRLVYDASQVLDSTSPVLVQGAIFLHVILASTNYVDSEFYKAELVDHKLDAYCYPACDPEVYRDGHSPGQETTKFTQHI
jgi:hypothetical protein